MIGRDYSKIGVERSKIAKVQNGSRNGIEGPIKIVGWLDTMTMVIIDRLGSIHLQTIAGTTHTTILSNHRMAQQSQSLNRETSLDVERITISGMDMSALDAFFMPELKRIVVADAKYFTTNISTSDWSHTTGFGKTPSVRIKSEFEGMNSISHYDYNGESMYVICDTENNNIKVVSELKKIVIQLGELGSLPFQFNEPVCVRCHIPLNLREIEGFDESFLPSWYLGTDYPVDNIELLFSVEPYIGMFFITLRDYRKDDSFKNYPNNFYTAKEIESFDVYDLFFLSDVEDMVIEQRLILAIPNTPPPSVEKNGNPKKNNKNKSKSKDENDKNLNEFRVPESTEVVVKPERIHKTLINNCTFQLARSENLSPLNKPYQSLHELVKSLDFCTRIHEKRPYVYVGVSERSNNRVQIFRLFWIRNNIYRPTFEIIHILGGQKELKVKLKYPMSIDFSPFGDLVICDVGLRRVFLFTPLINLVKSFTVPFKYDQIIAENKYLQSSQSSLSGESNNIGFGENNEYSSINGSKSGSKNNFTNKSKSNDLYSSQSSNFSLEELKESERENVMDLGSSLEFDDIPVTVAFAGDGKLAVGYDRGGVIVYPACSLMSVGEFCTLPLPVLHLLCSFSTYIEAKALRGCCKYFHNYTKDLRLRWNIYPLRKRVGDFMISLFMKWSRSIDWNIEKEHKTRKKLNLFYDFHGNKLCLKHLHMKYCDIDNFGNCRQKESHLPMNIDYYDYEKSEFFIELRNILLISCELFGLNFVWQYEDYIEKLFFTLSFERILDERSDPMSCQNEVTRNIVQKSAE